MKSAAEYANDFQAFRRDIDPDGSISEQEFYDFPTWEIEGIAQMIIDSK